MPEIDMYVQAVRISDGKRERMRMRMVDAKVERDRALEELARVTAERDEAMAFAERLESAASDREELDVFGVAYVPLPLDADGKPIHIGDVMEVISSKQRAKACYMQMGPSGTWAVGLTKNCHWYDTESLRHYHAPTVEDVLREFAQEMSENLGMYTGEAIDADEWRDADSKTIAEYAAKLRLAEEVDE